MEKPVDSDRPAAEGGSAVTLRLLGPMALIRDGVPVALPSSRKVRALLAYLALAPHPVARAQLCELLWDVPNDPRGELRWCLSKIRALVDAPDRRRVETAGDTVRIDLSDCRVDAVEVAHAAQSGIETLAADRLRALAALFAGDPLEGLEVERAPSFDGWLAAQRRRFRGCRTALLEHLVAEAAGEEIFGLLDQWLALAPFDRRVHEAMLAALAGRGRLREGDEHLAATVRLFDAEGLDHAPLREAWRAARARLPGASPRVADAPPRVGDASPPVVSRRASIAVMPFVEEAVAIGIAGRLSDGLVRDVITRLAKLRSLFVIAQGTVFALGARQVAPEEAGRTLNVDYVASGALRQRGDRLSVAVELAETRTARIVWAEVFELRRDGALAMLDEIGDRIVAAIDHEVEALERNRAILKPPNSLDAWEAHHRGLWHMFRFDRAENAHARHFFETALKLDPTFARAHAGLSFTYFQEAFQGWSPRAPAIDRAYEAAGQSLMVDDRDPTAHWAMGRALWLQSRHDQAVVELRRSIDLSPNFAMGHYTLAFVNSQAGDAQAAIVSADHSRALSPFDPMLFGMFGSRAMALVRLGRFDEAGDWGIKAADRPNAHVHIRAIAALSLALADRMEEAQGQVAAIRQTLPAYRVDDFLTAMQFDPAGERKFRQAAKRIGMS